MTRSKGSIIRAASIRQQPPDKGVLPMKLKPYLITAAVALGVIIIVFRLLPAKARAAILGA